MSIAVVTKGQLSKRLAMPTGFASRPGCLGVRSGRTGTRAVLRRSMVGVARSSAGWHNQFTSPENTLPAQCCKYRATT